MKNISLCAALFGFVGVVLGAFGAHALKEILSAHETTQVWHTAVLYHLLHAVAVWSTAMSTIAQRPWIRRAAVAWLIGVVLFSGSLYSLALGGPKWLGPVTPLGGLCFLYGWACAALGSREPADTAT